MSTKVFFTIDQGADLNKTIHKELGVDMSGYIGVCNLKTHHKSETRITINTSFNANGDVKVAATRAQTSYIKPGRYVYDIIASNDSGNTYSRVVEGYADVIAASQLPQELEPITIPRGVFGSFYIHPAEFRTSQQQPIQLYVGDTWTIPEELPRLSSSSIYAVNDNEIEIAPPAQLANWTNEPIIAEIDDTNIATITGDIITTIAPGYFYLYIYAAHGQGNDQMMSKVVSLEFQVIDLGGT